MESELAGLDLSGLYLIVGTLVVMNVGAIGGAFLFVIRLVWNASKLHSRIERLERDVNAAHQKLRDNRDD